MAKKIDSARLSSRDPWVMVGEARQHRGQIVADWLITALTFICSMWLWAPAAKRRRESTRPASARARLSPMLEAYSETNGRSES